jgi:hypothetical protein
MCTLIIGQHVIAPDTVLLAGNRDENPARPSRGPGVLIPDPPVVGGADAVAGGTWLAIRERRAAVAMLNRWLGDAPAPAMDGLRSRGQLTLDLAAAGADAAPGTGAAGPGTLAAAARHVAEASFATARYAPFSAVHAAPSGSWLFAHRGGGGAPEFTPITPGWHVLTHRELDDPDEPRAVHLQRALRGWRPPDEATARERLIALLASHEPPGVCIHEGRMATVSSFVVWLARDEARYHHVDGRPCEHALKDYTHLLGGPFGPGETA